MVALLDGIFCRIGLSLLLGVTFAMGIRGFWYGNALSGLVPFLIGTGYLISGRWKNPVQNKSSRIAKEADP